MSGEFVKAGYLVKSPPDFKAMLAQWHRRWFLLMDSKLVYPLASRYVRLEYYQSDQEAKRLADPKGVINLNSCTHVSSREPIKGHKHVFDVHTEERVYHLVAESGEEKQSWIDTLNKLLFTSPEVPSPGRLRRGSPPQQRKEDNVLRRTRDGSLKSQRPLSYTGSPSALHRPLPPVPNNLPPVKPARTRPLPPTPTTPPAGGLPSPQLPSRTDRAPCLHDDIKSSSPTPVKKRKPPPKPAPYKKAMSNPTTLEPVDIAGVYEVAPGQESVIVKPSPHADRRIPLSPLPVSVPSRSPDNDDEDYSILENATVVSADDTYSHLDNSKRDFSRSSHSTPILPSNSSGFHTEVLSNDDDYSLLQH